LGNFSATWASLRGWWETATPVTKAAATGLAAVVIIALIAATYMTTSPDYVPIYHGVSGKDAQSIESTLRDHQITMHYDDNGGTVSVPSKDESNATMYVEAAGVLSKDSSIEGIEQLDNIKMGTSPDVERKRILAADEGELARKLMDLDPVSTAAVTISPGSDTDLFTPATAPTASVILGLKPGNQLTDLQVRGIVNLVAHAVTGLTAQNVTLTDQTGTPLWKDNGQGGNAFGDGEPLSEDQKYAETVRKRVQGMLDMTIGPRKAIVTVNAELNFDQTQTHSVTHTPIAGIHGDGLPISTREKSENYSGSGSSMAGAPAGSASNLNVQTYAASSSSSGGGGTYKSSDTTTNYVEPNVQDTVTTNAPGAVKLLSVAALVDTTVNATDLPKIKDIIAANISATPGDNTRSVTVQQIAFDNSAQKAEADQIKTLASQENMQTWARYIGIALGFCFLLYMLMRTSGGGAMRRGEEPRLATVGAGSNIGLLEDIPEATLEPFLAEERPLRVEDVLAEMPEVVPRKSRRRPAVPSIEEQHDLKMESIQEMIAGNAEAVALLLKGWMAEETKFVGG
jgi:flagellar M-ring protein FliF